MTTEGSIADELPGYVPTSIITVEDDIEIETTADGDTTKTVYQLTKSPYERLKSVTAIVNGVQQDLEIGSDVIASNEDDDGLYHTISFVDTDPDVGSTATVEYDATPIIKRYVDAFDGDVNSVGELCDAILSSRGFENASGQRLDLLGAIFGEIGRRLGRDDTEYRSYLTSVATAFSATGTKSDIKFVAAGAFGIDESSVTVIEDTVLHGFEVEIDTTDALFAQSVNDLLKAASASGVELLRPPVLLSDDAEITFAASESTVTSEPDGLGSGTLN